MGILQTAERSSHLDPSENVIYQRHLIAYKEAAKLVSGTVLEVGSGEGYGIMELAPKADHYIATINHITLRTHSGVGGAAQHGLVQSSPHDLASFLQHPFFFSALLQDSLLLLHPFFAFLLQEDFSSP